MVDKSIIKSKGARAPFLFHFSFLYEYFILKLKLEEHHPKK